MQCLQRPDNAINQLFYHWNKVENEPDIYYANFKFSFNKIK